MILAAPTSAWRMAREASTSTMTARMHVDEIVVGIGEECRTAQRAGPLRRRIGRRDELRHDIGSSAPGGVIECRQVFPDRSRGSLRIPLGVPIQSRNRALAVGIRLDEAGVDRKTLAAYQTLSDAALHHRLEQMAENVALPETTVAVLREGRVIGHLAFQAQSAEPPISQIEVHFLAQAPFRTNATAVADDQHPDHQFRIDRRSTGGAVEGGEVAP